MACRREWLASVLKGEPVSCELPLDGEGLLAAAELEGVTALVARQLVAQQAFGTDIDNLFADEARRVAAGHMFREVEHRRIFAALVSAGLSPVLLKGSALGYWLYPASYLRATADFDLLLESPEQAREAADVLRAQGYAGGVYFGPEAHELTVQRRMDSGMTVEIDLHWRLFNHPAFSEVLPVKEILLGAVSLPDFEEPARALNPSHATVHACLHRAMNLHMGVDDKLKWIYDLHLLVCRLSSDEWHGVLTVCKEHRVGAVCLHGFLAAATTFGTPLPPWVEAQLLEGAQQESIDPHRLGNWGYMQLVGLRSIPSVARQVAWLYQKLLPSTDYLRSFYGQHLTTSQLWMERMRRLISRFR